MADPSAVGDSVPVFPDADGAEVEISDMNEVAEAPPEDGEEYEDPAEAEDGNPFLQNGVF